MNPLFTIVGFVLGIIFTASVSYANITTKIYEESVKICEPNQGLKQLHANMWNKYEAYCNNGVVFVFPDA